MAIQSKYSNTQVETIISELLAVLEKHQAPTDLKLMVLGNCVSHTLNTEVSPQAQADVAAHFANALTHAIKK